MGVGDDGLVEEPRLRAMGGELMRLGRRRATSYPGSVLEDSAFRILLLPRATTLSGRASHAW